MRSIKSSNDNALRITIDELQRNSNQDIEAMRIVFGPHYYINIKRDGTALSFELGATHHGFKTDASQVGVGLEKLIEAIRELFPKVASD